MSAINKSNPNCQSCLGDFTSKEPAVFPATPSTCMEVICLECFNNSYTKDKMCPVSKCKQGGLVVLKENQDYDGLNESESAIVYLANRVSTTENLIHKSAKLLKEHDAKMTRQNEKLVNLENVHNDLLREVQYKQHKVDYLNAILKCITEESITSTMTFKEHLSKQNVLFSSLKNAKKHQASTSSIPTPSCQSQRVLSTVLDDLSVIEFKEYTTSLIDRVRKSNDPALESALIIFEFVEVIRPLDKEYSNLFSRVDQTQGETSKLKQKIFVLKKKNELKSEEIKTFEHTIASLKHVIQSMQDSYSLSRRELEHEEALPSALPSPHFVPTPISHPCSSSSTPPCESKAPCHPPEISPTAFKADVLNEKELAMEFRSIPNYSSGHELSINSTMNDEQIAKCIKALKLKYDCSMSRDASLLIRHMRRDYPRITFREFADALRQSGITPGNYIKLLRLITNMVWGYKEYLRHCSPRESTMTHEYIHTEFKTYARD